MICSLSAAETQSNLTSSDSIIASVTWSNPDTTNVTRVLAEVERLHGESAALSGLASGSLSIATGETDPVRGWVSDGEDLPAPQARRRETAHDAPS